MCGRYALVVEGRELWEQLGLEGEPMALTPRYNVAPTQAAPVVGLREGASKPRLVHMRWGLVPSGAEDVSVGARMINARSETAAQKPAFREALSSRRCLAPATGFFEWKAEGKKKQPYLITLPEQRLFTLAGLWERWLTPEKERVFSFTILTTEATPALAQVHPRMPVRVAPEERRGWLAQSVVGAEALAHLVSMPTSEYVVTPVSSRVSNVRNDDAACLEPLS